MKGSTRWRNTQSSRTRRMRAIRTWPCWEREGADDDVGARGFILTREGDMKSGRPVSFVFAGETADEDGKSVFLRPEQVRDSVNAKLVEAGLAYPLFYETLFKELREVLIAALQAARAADREYISLDASMTGAVYAGPNNLNELPPIFPKLFRRLDEWNGETLAGFRLWLEQNDNERLFTLPDGRFLGIQDVVAVEGGQVRLLYAPEDMVFRPKRPGPPS